MTDIANVADTEKPEVEIEITPEMIEAGEDVILCEVGGANLGGLFSAPELAARVFRAMDSVRNGVPYLPDQQIY